MFPYDWVVWCPEAGIPEKQGLWVHFTETHDTPSKVVRDYVQHLKVTGQDVFAGVDTLMFLVRQLHQTRIYGISATRRAETSQILDLREAA